MWHSLRSLFLKKDKEPKEINMSKKLPVHVAIIMDGNGRWAQKRGLPRSAGHRAGMEAIKRIVRDADELGIKYLTLYAFSTENWCRPKVEVEFLMRLPSEYLKTELSQLNANNVQIRITGELDKLPGHTKEAVLTALNDTVNNNGMVLNFALNYGSRTELVRATKTIAELVAADQLKIEDINENVIEQHLYTTGIPDPDLLIRPSGEARLSNFLLWQLAYSELWFSEVYWPDFRRQHLLQALGDYAKRDRRYGGIKL